MHADVSNVLFFSISICKIKALILIFWLWNWAALFFYSARKDGYVSVFCYNSRAHNLHVENGSALDYSAQ